MLDDSFKTNPVVKYLPNSGIEPQSPSSQPLVMGIYELQWPQCMIKYWQVGIKNVFFIAELDDVQKVVQDWAVGEIR